MPEYDMSQEKRPPTILPEGARLVRVTEMILGTSKNGNEMYTTTIEDVKLRKSMQVWLVATPKKRWLLKSLLEATGAVPVSDGIYRFDTADIIGKSVIALIEHSQEPWTNREGNEVMQTKAKVTEFQAPELGTNGEPIAWED